MELSFDSIMYNEIYKILEDKYPLYHIVENKGSKLAIFSPQNGEIILVIDYGLKALKVYIGPEKQLNQHEKASL